MSKPLSTRLERLEARRPDPPHILTNHILDRLTDEELAELSDMFALPGVEEISDLPPVAQARVLNLASLANNRDTVPGPSSSAAYAAWAERVQSRNPATTSLPWSGL